MFFYSDENLWKMPKICVKAPEIVMSGDINISAAMTVVTKAKLESVTVGGDCDCGDVPHITDYVILIDGSDSYNTKVAYIFYNWTFTLTITPVQV